MNYEAYKSIVTKPEYLKTWELNGLDRLNATLADAAYEKYTIKAKIFQRANFKCQNINCKTPEAPLTWHHIRWQKNNGKDSERNGVCLCKECHDGFHQATLTITYSKKNVPKHVAGHSFRLEYPDKINRKVLRRKMKAFRRSIRSECGYEISDKELFYLFRLLFS